jgi:VWFA-related protein
MKTKKNNPGGLLILFLILNLCFSIPSFPLEKEQEAIKHEVSVTRVLIPLFAYDSGGNPVFDLKMEDIRLFVNGKAVEISDLNLMQFEYSQEITKKVKEKRGPTTVSRDRVVFLIVDTMFNSIYGIRRARKIVNQFIESDSPGIQYVIMENSLFGGLKLIGGPETDKNKLKKFLKKIHQLPDTSTTAWSRNTNIRQSNEESAQWQKVERDERIEKERIKYFYEFLASLKYALQSINQPKMILLVSEGIPELLFFEVNPYVKNHAFVDTNLLDQIKKTVKAINEGGGVLYAVYSGRTNLMLSHKSGGSSSSAKSGQIGALAPEEGDFTVGAANIPIVDGSGIESLKSLALGTGGRYFDDFTERVVKEIQDTTAAYYELAFSPGSSPDGKMNISIKCSRKGIKMDFPSRIETSSYKDMNKIQKKVFALNVVLKRNWTWALAQGKARAAQFGWLDEKEQLRVTMPAEMNGRQVDIFLIRFDKDFQNPYITMESRTAANTEILKIPQKGNDKDLYMVIIEPESTTCIYNKIK